MLIASYRLVPYRLAVEPPFRWRGGEVGAREGVLIRLEETGGGVGWGDAAPLPGFSPETLHEAVAALEAAARRLVGREVDALGAGDPASPHHAALDGLGLVPSARYALDLALAELAALALRMPLPALFDRDAPAALPLAALLDGAPESVVDAAGARAAEGYRALELKVGRLDPHSDAEIARDVRARVGAAVELRVDANRAWTPDEAAAFADHARVARLAYVEEPLLAVHAGDLVSLARETGLPVALDETLAEPGGGEQLVAGIHAAVLKPTVLGGVAVTLRLAARARSVRARPVLSAAFESGVGQRGVAALAAATGAEAAGLDPYRRLVGDVLDVRLPFDCPLVDVSALFAQHVQVSVRETSE